MEPEKALLRFAWKMTKALPEMAEAVVEQLRDLGWDDEAIY
jgi:alkylhydroperoxidase family enzyme